MDYRTRWQQRRRQKERQRLLFIPAALLLGVGLVWLLRAGGERAVRWEVHSSRHLLPRLAAGTQGEYVVWADGHIWSLHPPQNQAADSIALYSFPDRFCGRPLAAEGVLYFGSDLGVMRAVSESGELLWRRETGGAIRGQPLLQADNLYFGNDSGKLYCLSRQQGRPHWVRELGAAIAAEVAGGDGIIYAATTRGEVYALRAGSGEVVWQRDLLAPIFSPVLATGSLVGVGTDSGELYLLRADSGKNVARYVTRGPLRAPLVANNETLCFAGSDGWVRGVSADGQTPKWQYHLGGPVTAGPVLMGDHCLVARRGKLALLQLADGRCLRSLRGEPFGSSLLVTSELIYAGTTEGRVIAFARPQ